MRSRIVNSSYQNFWIGGDMTLTGGTDYSDVVINNSGTGSPVSKPTILMLQTAASANTNTRTAIERLGKTG